MFISEASKVAILVVGRLVMDDFSTKITSYSSKTVPFNFFFHRFVNFAEFIFPGEPLLGQSLFVLIAKTKLLILYESYRMNYTTHENDLEGSHFRWLKIKGIICRILYLGSAIFQPSKIKLVKRDSYLLDLTMSMTRLPTPAWAAPASNTALKSFILYPTLKR